MMQHKTDWLSPSHGPVSDFSPRTQEPCFCGSSNTFGNCCGSTRAVRPPPYGVYIFENYVAPEITRELTEYADQCEGERLTMIDSEHSTPDNIVRIADDRRITERVKLGDRWQQINDLVRDIFVNLAEDCYGVQLDWYEAPDLMRYRTGGLYVRHADSENMDPASQTWSKVIDRDLSLLLYLNDDFEGGKLTFNKLNYWIRPRAGTAVIFPSDHRYMHQAETVTQGTRYAIVSWASVRGIPKIAEMPPACAMYVQQSD